MRFLCPHLSLGGGRMDASGELAPLSSFASFDIASSGILLSTPGAMQWGGNKQQVVSPTSHRYPGSPCLVQHNECPYLTPPV